MLFNSLHFLIFFPIVLLIYYIIPAKSRYLWLLAASYYFYMCWNASYAILILTTTVITYSSGLLLEMVKRLEVSKALDHSFENQTTKNQTKEAAGSKSGKPSENQIAAAAGKRLSRWKKLIVAVSFLSNLGILFYFKYFNFAVSLVTQLFAVIKIQLNIPAFDILLPVGISFYTFQALSYTMDIYRDEVKAEKNFLRYALFVSFFPQVLAGPIQRSRNMLKQLELQKSFCFEEARDGFLLMIWGYFLKLVLADRIAIFVDTVYGDPLTYTGWYSIVAVVLYAVQIYCDFSGYSTTAIGAAKMLGVDLGENFSAPYLSTSVANFWRKWHISLTTWFKYYLYVPLGGNRKGKFRKYLNKMIVFLVSGLWHGASLSFVVWGGLNGLYQIAGEVLQPVRDKAVSLLHLNRASLGHKAVKGLVTFVLIDFSWIFFRANDFALATEMIHSIAAAKNIWVLLDGSLFTCGLDAKNFYLMLIGIGILLFADIAKLRGIRIREIIAVQDYWCRYLIMILAICSILIFGIWGSGYDAAGFIYFQF